MRVSQATRPRVSFSRTASRTASEIWSAILSGCPSVTDSEVKMKSAATGGPPCLLVDTRNHLTPGRIGRTPADCLAAGGLAATQAARQERLDDGVRAQARRPPALAPAGVERGQHGGGGAVDVERPDVRREHVDPLGAGPC